MTPDSAAFTVSPLAVSARFVGIWSSIYTDQQKVEADAGFAQDGT